MKLDSAKWYSAERDSAKRDSAKRDSAKRDSAKRDSAKRDSAKRDSAKRDSPKRDSAKTGFGDTGRNHCLYSPFFPHSLPFDPFPDSISSPNTYHAVSNYYSIGLNVKEKQVLINAWLRLNGFVAASNGGR